MEESSNLQEGGRDVPSEGGGAPEAAAAASADAAQVAGQVDPHTDQGDPVDNPQVNPKFRLLPGDNIQDILEKFTLTTLQGSTWCKCWHNGSL